MKNILFVLIGVFLFVNAQAQYKLNPADAETILQNRKEVFFKFDFNDNAEILRKAASFISIDHLSGNGWAYAYASEKGFNAFKKLGLEYQLLYNPSELIDPQMWSPAEREKYEWEEYPTYDGYVDLMQQFESDYPDLCRVESIGTTIEGRELLVAKITDNPEMDENEPEFFYTSTMHGDETAGYVLMLRYIDYLLSNYGSNARITGLVDNMEIFINPNANPDGTYATGNDYVTGATRGNANGIDLNRNYPDPAAGPHPDGNPWQPETEAFMDFAETHDFVISANFHGGAEVFNYPWDTWSRNHADKDWFQFVGREYADTVHSYSPSGYFDDLNNGVTNGYEWYRVKGGRQDYMNYMQRCREVTIELSNRKLLQESELENHWNYNYRSLLNYMQQATYGIQGIVVDDETSNAVKAEVIIEGHDEDNSSVFTSMPLGNYNRPIKSGTYDIIFSADCYENKTIEGITVENHTKILQNVALTLVFEAEFSADQTHILAGDEVHFTGESCENPDSWEWAFEGGTPATSSEQNPTVRYEDPGNYAVELRITKDAESDTEIKADYITVDVNTARDFQEQSQKIKVFPNPTFTGKFAVQSSVEITKIEVINLTGELVNSLKPDIHQDFIYIDDLENGMYILRLYNQNEIFSKKIQVVK